MGSTRSCGPLIGAAPVAPVPSRREQLRVAAAVGVLTVLVYLPTLRNGFLALGFDDALITDTPAIRALTWHNLSDLVTRSRQAHYVPLTMVSFALDCRVWGLDPRGFHLTNVLLHAAVAALAYLFMVRLVGGRWAAACAALLFAVHPLQLEAVSLAVQRKTLLSGLFFFLTFLAYQRWRDHGRRADYVLSVALFVAAAAAKPSVVTLPALLIVYDYVFGDGRVRVMDKVPFAAVSVVATVAAVLAHHAVDAVHGPHGGAWLPHGLMVSRVVGEYLVAVFVPVGLSPIYYYPPDVLYNAANWMVAAGLIGGSVMVAWQRRRCPWTFFCTAWFVVLLAPESNIVPLAQLRADRFVYLPLLGVCLWGAAGLERMLERQRARTRAWVRALAVATCAVFALLTMSSAGVWHDDVSAWERVVATHPWCGRASQMLGRAHLGRNDQVAAEAAFTTAAQLAPRLPDPHLSLGRLYAAQGRTGEARVHVHRFLELAPGDTDGVQLSAALTADAGS